MPNTRSKHHFEQFWEKRVWKQVMRDNNLEAKRAEYIASAENRFAKTESNNSSFLEANAGKQLGENSGRFIPSNDINNLTFWIEHSSYTFCNKCMMILPLRLLPNFQSAYLSKRVANCVNARQNDTECCPNQFGSLSVFLTISPYEWSFPIPHWLSSLRNLTGKGPTQLAAYETIHITHVLEQIICGYLCG